MSRSQQHKVYVQGFASDGQAMAEGVHNPFNPFDDEEGGEEGWWDETALVDIDFVNDRAWTAADGEVAISTLVGADPDSDNSYGPTEFLSENMEADGYHFILDSGLPQGTMSLAAIGVLETILLAGATFRVQWKWRDTGTADDTVLALAKSDGSNVNYLWVNGVSGRVSFSDWNGSFEEVLDGSIDLDAGDHNCVAATVAGSRAEFSVNGSDAQAVEDTFDAIPSGTTVALLSLAPTSVLQTLTVYTPLPDTTGLAELSALS